MQNEVQPVEFNNQNFGSYATDSDLETGVGVWLKFPGKRRIRILRAGGANRAFGRRYAILSKPYRREMDQDILDPDISERIMRQLYAEHVVVDWEGITTPDGTAIPYNPEAGIEFFTAFPEVLKDIINYATEAATFVAEDITEAKDTLGKP